MRLMRNHKVWIYVRSANSNPQIAFDRMNDLIDEAAGHGFLVRGTSVDQCSGNTLKDRDGLRIMIQRRSPVPCGWHDQSPAAVSSAFRGQFQWLCSRAGSGTACAHSH